MDLYMVFDVESVGLHGQGFAVGYVVVDETGLELDSGIRACPLSLAEGWDKDREWVIVNVETPIVGDKRLVRMPTPRGLREWFWDEWLRWKEQGARLVADCGWPVEARFLSACVDDRGEDRRWEGPYPLLDLASLLVARGKDPLADVERLESERPAHNPLADARQSARLWIENLQAG